MRLLLGLVLALVLAAGCSGPAEDEPEAPSTSSIGPEDTLPVLGAWFSEPAPGTGERLVLTLSDDNSYSITDSCVELPGRWQLSQGKVELTPKPSENVLCPEVSEPPAVADSYEVEGESLVPVGDGPVFTRE